MFTTTRTPSALALRVVFLLPLAFAGCDAAVGPTAALEASESAARAGRWGGPDTPPLAEVAVMSQNLYLGADLNTVAAEPNPALIPLRVAQFYGAVVATDPAARMEAVADEIVRVRPHLVGLQEVTTYYVQTPGDNLPGRPNTPATAVTFDFLALLLDALADRGLTYTVASRNDLSDVELPATTNGQTFFDVRYRDADVILALADPDVSTSQPVERDYRVLFTVPVGGVNQTFFRGYQSVRATVDGFPFTFFNTHLEVAAVAPVQIAQGNELKALIDATAGAVVLVGDLNSDADGGSTPTYATITGSVEDVFDRPNLPPSPTCCQAPDLRNETSLLDERIDFVLFRGFDRARLAETVLDEPADRTPTAYGLLWPSDHAGVAALLIQNLRRARPNV